MNPYLSRDRLIRDNVGEKAYELRHDSLAKALLAWSINVEDKMEKLSQQLNLAVKYVQEDPTASIVKSRRILEKILFNVFLIEMKKEPKRSEIGFILNDNIFTKKINRRIISRMQSTAIQSISSHPLKSIC